MRILLLNRVAAPVGGGMNQYVLDVAERLKAAGDTVALVHGRQPQSEFRGTGYVFNHLDAESPDNHEVRLRLEAVVDDFKPDIIQLHGVQNIALDGWLAARAPTVRFVHTHRLYCSGNDMTLDMPRQLCQRTHGRGCLACHVLRGCGSPNPIVNLRRYTGVSRALAALARLHGVQVASPALRDNLVRNGVPEARISLLPLYASSPLADRRPHATGRRMLLHVGGMLKKKGVWLLLEGLSQLPKEVELVFAGGGEQQEDVEEAVRRRGLGDQVRVMGELTPHEWSTLYHQASLVLMPSRWNEPLGLSGLQAMAHGRPVVAFRSQGIAEWLEDGVNGSLVEFNNGKEFLAVVRDLLGHPSRLVEMGKRAQSIWEKRFQPKHHVEKLRQYYREIVEASGQPRLV